MKPIHFASIQGSVNMFKLFTKLGSDPRSPTQDNVKKVFNYIFLVRIFIFAVLYVCT